MRFAEVNLFGVYVAPISLMMVAAWFGTIALRRAAPTASACYAMSGTRRCSSSPST